MQFRRMLAAIMLVLAVGSVMPLAACGQDDGGGGESGGP